MGTKTNFLIEKKLMQERPDLHLKIKENIVAFEGILESFFARFPEYTDHTILHSLDVLYYANELIGEQVERLSAAECYALIMSCYLHDTGMGVNQKDYEEFSKKINFGDYFEKHKDAKETDIVRDFHHEYSGFFIRKYADLFEIPNEDMLFAIVQISRGHRKTNLLDEREYPDIETPDGVLRTAYLSAIIRLADEIDMGKDRNSELLFDTSKVTTQYQSDIFGIHESIKSVLVENDCIVLNVLPKAERFKALCEDWAKKLQKTLDYCRNVVNRRSDFRIAQTNIKINWIC